MKEAQNSPLYLPKVDLSHVTLYLTDSLIAGMREVGVMK